MTVLVLLGPGARERGAQRPCIEHMLVSDGASNGGSAFRGARRGERIHQSKRVRVCPVPLTFIVVRIHMSEVTWMTMADAPASPPPSALWAALLITAFMSNSS